MPRTYLKKAIAASRSRTRTNPHSKVNSTSTGCDGTRISVRVASPLWLLDRRSDEVPPLRPGPVVVLHVRVAEEVLQREPRVAGPLADPAVRDDLLVRRHALRLVQLPQVVQGLERAIRIVHRLGPWNVLRAGDVPAALRVLRRVLRRREDLPAELLRAPDVDEDLVLHPHRLADVVQVHADRVVRLLRVERRVRVRGHVLREGQLLEEPLLAPAVHEDDVLDPVVLEDPERERREPVVEIPVEDELHVVRHTEPAEEVLELRLRDDVPRYGVVDVLPPVDQAGGRNVPEIVVRGRVVVHLDDPDLRIADETLDPARVHQNFRMCVVCHRSVPQRRRPRLAPLHDFRIQADGDGCRGGMRLARPSLRPHWSFARTFVASPGVHAFSVVVRPFPWAPIWRTSCITASSFGISMTPTKSYCPIVMYTSARPPNFAARSLTLSNRFGESFTFWIPWSVQFPNTT